MPDKFKTMMLLLSEIEEGYSHHSARKADNNTDQVKGIGSKSFITTRVDMLRQKLLDLKKDLHS